MGAYDYNPPKPKATQDNSAAGGSGGKTTAPVVPSATTTPVDPNAPAPGGYDVGPVHFGFTNRGVPGVSWSGSNWVPSSQRVHNVIDRTTSNMGLNLADAIMVARGADPATLKLERAQMNQQMPPQDKALADAIGQLNPTLALRSIPAVGPLVQGAVQEGVKGWAQGEDWRQIAKDATVGAAGGAGSGVIGTPKALGETIGTAVTSGLPAAAGWLYGGNFDDTLGGIGGPSGGFGAGIAGKYMFEPWNEAIQKAVSGTVPSWATGLGSQIPLAGASYWNQEQRDKAALSGRQ